MEKDSFQLIAVKACLDYEEKHKHPENAWNTASVSETEKIWAVIDAIVKELDRREKHK